jgi:hypothetical protein
MKAILMAMVCAAGAWYWFMGSRQISESDVQAFYAQEMQWMDESKGKELCGSIDDKYLSHVTTVSAAGRVQEEADKAKTCQALEKLFEVMAKLNNEMGGGVVLNLDANLDQTSISSDKKTATVKVRSIVRMGTEKVLIMKISSDSSESFTKRGGKLFRTGAEGKVLME